MGMVEYIHRGGPIMYVLIAANIISFSVVCWKVLLIWSEKKNVTAKAQQLADSIVKDCNGKPTVEYAREQIQLYVHTLEKGMNVVKLTATTSPLLGLLGTVLGILSAFETISHTGLGNPAQFAGGIAMALVTTAGGLLVSIPNNILYNVLMSNIEATEFRLETHIMPKMVS